MSPLGPISVFPSQLLQPLPPQLQLPPLPRLALLGSSNYFFHSAPLSVPPQPSEHLLRFMTSVSLGHSQPRRRHGHSHSHRHHGLSKSRNMTLLNESQNFKNGGSKNLLHGIRNFIHPEVEERGGVSVEEEEHLSIYDADETADEPVGPVDKTTAGDESEGEIDVDDSMSTVTMTTASQSPSPSSSHSIRSPTPPDSEAGNHDHRLRNYSSEDSMSLKSLRSLNSVPANYNPLSSLSEALISNTFQQADQQRHQASLLFSIANILRPDFGLGRLPSFRADSAYRPDSLPVPPPPSMTFQHYSKSHASQRSVSKRKSSFPEPALTLDPKRCKTDTIPIDLSRPPELPKSKVNSRKSATNQHRTPQQWSPPFPQGPPPGCKGVEKNEEVKLGSSGGQDKADDKKSATSNDSGEPNWPAWVYCTRYSDRPSSGPRARRSRKQKEKEADEKRPRTAFTADQLSRLKKEFEESKYLNEKRRQDLANDLGLHENQIKIWFQNKRAKNKKSSGKPGGLAEQLRAQGLYNHSTIQSRGCGDEDEEDSD